MADGILVADIKRPALMDFSHLSFDGRQREIRVLELHAGEYDDSIACSLRFENLDDAPNYEALSYVWGDPDITTDISLNGQNFAITINLAVFFRRIRLPTRSRLLWVDALCINQNDNPEKSQQVHLMGTIYKNSQQGLIWLGELESQGATADDAKALFDFLEYIVFRKSLEESDLAESKLEKIFDTMKAMMSSQWWQRIWTIQEALLPTSATVIWGSESVLWSTIEGAALQFVISERYFSAQNPMPHLTHTMGQILNSSFLYHVSAMRQTREGENPLKTLCRFRGRYASDPRDKVFGLLGLFPKALYFDGYASDTDYNLSVGAVFARTTLDLIRGSGGLRPLVGRNCAIPKPHPGATLGCPTWAVDWVAWDNGDYMRQWWDHYVNYKVYNSAGDAALNFTYNEEDLSLSFEGLQIGTVMKVIDIHEVINDGSPNPVNAILALKQEVQSHFNFNSPYISGCSWEEAFWRTMIGNLLPIGEYSNAWAQEEDVWAFQRCCTGSTQDSLLCAGAVNQLDFHTLFITRSGHLGIGPLYTSVGDEAWVFLGSRVPFLLHPLVGKERQYTLVGDCYAHGVMNGEALNGPGGKRKTETVTLQ